MDDSLSAGSLLFGITTAVYDACVVSTASGLSTRSAITTAVLHVKVPTVVDASTLLDNATLRSSSTISHGAITGTTSPGPASSRTVLASVASRRAIISG